MNDSAAVEGWDAPGLMDATGWEPATAYTLPSGIVLEADAMEPTVVTSTVPARNVSARGDGSFVVEMEELFTGWFEVANLAGAPGSTVTFNVSTMEGTVEEYNMANAYTFGASGAGNFRMRFSYNEIQYITINGLSKPPALADVVGKRRPSTSPYRAGPVVVVPRQQGVRYHGEQLPRPHDGRHDRRLPYLPSAEVARGRRYYTSYQFALAHFGVGAYFTKWARDFADVQTADGNVPSHAADGERRSARVVEASSSRCRTRCTARTATRASSPKCTRRCSGCSPSSPTTPTRPTSCCFVDDC